MFTGITLIDLVIWMVLIVGAFFAGAAVLGVFLGLIDRFRRKAT